MMMTAASGPVVRSPRGTPWPSTAGLLVVTGVFAIVSMFGVAPVEALPGRGIIAVYFDPPDGWLKNDNDVTIVNYTSDGFPPRTAYLNRWGRPKPVGMIPKDWPWERAQYVEFPGNRNVSCFFAGYGDARTRVAFLASGPGIYYVTVLRFGPKEDKQIRVEEGQLYPKDCPTNILGVSAPDCSGLGECSLKTGECECRAPFGSSPTCSGIPGSKCNQINGQVPQTPRTPMTLPPGYVFNGTSAAECCAFCYNYPLDPPCKQALFDAMELSCKLLNETVRVWTVVSKQPYLSAVTPPPKRTTRVKSSDFDKPVAFITGAFALIALVSSFGSLFAKVFLQPSARDGGSSRSAAAGAGSRYTDDLAAGGDGGGDPNNRGDGGPLSAVTEGGGPASTNRADRFAMGDRYRILGEIGHGAFSRVFLVHKRGEPSQPYAMKVVECRSLEEEKKAFEEYMSMRRLQDHPGIIQLVDMTISLEEAPRDVPSLHPGEDYDGLDGDDEEYNPHATMGMDDSGRSNRAHREDSAEAAEASAGSLHRMTSDGSIDAATASAPVAPPSPGHGPVPPTATRQSAFRGGRRKVGFAYFIMTYYPEGTLEHGIRRDKAFFARAPVILSYFAQLSSALSHSHDHDIVHLDLKPGNVLLHHNGTQCVVSDFGLSRNTVDGANLSNAGGGTLYYQAPEQFHRQTSKKSDVWALACVIFAMATGRVGGDTCPMFFHRGDAGFEELVAGPMREADLPDVAVGLLLRMLSVDPADRPSMKDISIETHGML